MRESIANAQNAVLYGAARDAVNADPSTSFESSKNILRAVHGCSVDLTAHFKEHGNLEGINGVGPKTRRYLERILKIGAEKAREQFVQEGQAQVVGILNQPMGGARSDQYDALQGEAAQQAFESRRRISR